MIPENGLAKFIKFYPGGFAEYKYPQFQNSEESALDGGDEVKCSFQDLNVQYEFGF